MKFVKPWGKSWLLVTASSCSYIVVNWSFSLDSAIIPHLLGGSMYLIGGFLLYDSFKSIRASALYFTPFLITIFVALTGNPGLFPDVVPVLIGICIISFYAGAKIQYFVLSRQKLKALTILTLLVGILYLDTKLLIPRLLFWKMATEPIEVNLKDTVFLSREGDTVKIDLNKISVIDFWFFRCSNCYAHNDLLDEIAGVYRNSDIKFYLIDMGHIDSFEHYKNFNSERWANLIHVYDINGVMSKRFGVQAAPHASIISNNKIIYTQLGFSIDSKEIEKVEISSILNNESAKLKQFRKSVSFVVESTRDFGRIHLNDSVNYTFKILSSGDYPLEIKNIKASCECVVTNCTKTSIKKGEIGSVEVSLKATAIGRLEKTIVLETNAENPLTVLKIYADVEDNSHHQ